MEINKRYLVCGSVMLWARKTYNLAKWITIFFLLPKQERLSISTSRDNATGRGGAKKGRYLGLSFLFQEAC